MSIKLTAKHRFISTSIHRLTILSTNNTTRDNSHDFLPIHDELMSAGHKSQAVAVVERFGYILTERITSTSAKGGGRGCKIKLMRDTKMEYITTTTFPQILHFVIHFFSVWRLCYNS